MPKQFHIISQIVIVVIQYKHVKFPGRYFMTFVPFDLVHCNYLIKGLYQETARNKKLRNFYENIIYFVLIWIFSGYVDEKKTKRICYYRQKIFYILSTAHDFTYKSQIELLKNNNNKKL